MPLFRPGFRHTLESRVGMFAVRFFAAGSRVSTFMREAGKKHSRFRLLSLFLAAGLALFPALPSRAQSTDSGSPHQKRREKESRRKSRKLPSNAHATPTAAARPARSSARERALARRRHYHPHRLTARELARSRRIHSAFVASSQLRPMAQQLAQMRTPAAYAGVSAWARSHRGEAAAAAYRLGLS